MRNPAPEVTVLSDALRKGLGRAVIMARDQYSVEFRPAILHACRNNLAYDRQCEGLRDFYLYDLIQACPDADYYRSAILDLLRNPRKSDCHAQLARIGYRFATQGYDELKDALWHGFRGHAREIGFAGDEELIKLDGFPAFREIVNTMDETGYKPEDWEYDVWFDALKEREGEDAAQAWIAAESGRNDSVKRAWDKIAASRALFEEKRKPLPSTIESYAAIRDRIQKSEKAIRGGLSSWGQKASEEELKSAAQDLLNERHPARLASYLQIFQKREFPLDVEDLIPLARHESEEVARVAQLDLSNSMHPSVRNLAFELLTGEEPDLRAARLLRWNYRPDDHVFLESLWERARDDFDRHSLGFALTDIYEKSAPPESAESMRLLYEHGPCTLCRRLSVMVLQKLNQLPDWMAEECRWDAYDGIRELVA